MSIIQSHITVMTTEQMDQVHEYTLKLLENVGVSVECPRARAIYCKATGGCVDDEIVRVPREIVERALSTVPSVIDIYNRHGKLAFQLGGENNAQTRFGIGVTNLFYQDPQTDEVSKFSRKNFETAVRLGDNLPEFDIITTPGIIRDIPVEELDYFSCLEQIANTTKPLITLCSTAEQFGGAMDLFEHLNGNLSERPFMIPYFNPVTPLALNIDTTDKMFSTIERGLPFIYANYGMSGATTPITGAGTLVLLNAELMMGLVLTQLIKEKAPIILGIIPAFFNMKTMISAFTPQTITLNLACAEMMNHYGIPHSGTSGSCTGWGPDLLASGTLWMNHLTACLGKVGMAPMVGGNFDSLAFSPTMVVYSNEIIRQARLFAAGFELDDAAIGFDEMAEAGPAGNYVMTERTVELYKGMDAQNSGIWPGFSLEQWQDADCPKVVDLLREHTLQILANLKMPEDHDELIAKGEKFIEKLPRVLPA